MSTAFTQRPPVYFLSIGGPNFMENHDHPAYHQLVKTGYEITNKVKPKAIVVFSAHWQPSSAKIQVNVAEKADIIYDFYGFPPHFYAYKFPSKGSPEIAEKVINKLEGAGIEVERVKRGLDHGIWAGFVVAFDPKTNPLDCPIVQVSLFDNEDTDAHYRIGQVLESLRDENILIIGAGMGCHNLQDFRLFRESSQVMPYVYTFDEALKNAAEVPVNERQASLLQLMKRPDARQAHPTLDHILPFHVAAGAAGVDKGERIWTLPEKSLSWAQFRFGSVPT